MARGLCEKHYNRQYRESHKKEMAEYKKQHRESHKEEIAKQRRQHYQEHKEEVDKRAKQYRETHKGKMAEYWEQYRKTHKKEIAEWSKKWGQTPNGKASMKASCANRRALTKDLTLEMVKRVYEDNIRCCGVLTCCLCGKPIKSGEDCLEHSIPLSRGGANNYENLGVAHRKCNRAKWTMTMEEWFGNKL